MLRVINFLCVALAGFACLALYHVSEQTRVAHLELKETEQRIVAEQSEMKVLQADWQRVADPARIQRLAQRHLGLTGDPVREFASLQLLPRRGDSLPVGNDAQVNTASDTVPVPAPNPELHFVAVQAGN